MASIHLQGIGLVEAVPVSELRVGSVLVYNYGYRGEVVAVQSVKGGRSVVLSVRAGDGKVYCKRRLLSTLVAVAK
jgi:hypothetical protein